jgi:hypothetical protein
MVVCALEIKSLFREQKETWEEQRRLCVSLSLEMFRRVGMKPIAIGDPSDLHNRNERIGRAKWHGNDTDEL